MNRAPNGVILAKEFARMAVLAADAIDDTPDPSLSCRICGIWELRSRHGQLLAEVSAVDGVAVSAVFNVDPGVVERISDLRRCGMGSRAIVEWMTCTRRRLDPADESQEVMRIALRCKG